MSEVTARNSWLAKFPPHLPLDRQRLARIPSEIRQSFWGTVHGLDGRIPRVRISSRERVLRTGPLRVTSCGDLSVKKETRNGVSSEKELTFSLEPDSGAGSQPTSTRWSTSNEAVPVDGAAAREGITGWGPRRYPTQPSIQLLALAGVTLQMGRGRASSHGYPRVV